jgi:hypothetical protein
VVNNFLTGRSEEDHFDLRLEVSTGETIEHAGLLCRPVYEVMKSAAALGLLCDGIR